MDAFISHSSKNRLLARKVEASLAAAGLKAWLDDSDLNLGALLRSELQKQIGGSRTVVLLWSKPASQSRWINAEWLTAYHLDKFIVPCKLDDTLLPQCLQSTVYMPLGRGSRASLERVTRAVREAPAARNDVLPPMRSESADLAAAIATTANDQQLMTDALLARDLDKASELQQLLDDVMTKATRAWPFDPVVVNLDGYHQKNAYMLKYWDAIQAGRAPADPLLVDAERRFFDSLAIDPADPAALNGLGSVLILERELEAAEFFVVAAIKAAKARGLSSYPAAEQDLQLIRSYRQAGRT